MPADIDESRQPDESPVQFVQRLACEKAHIIAERKTGLVVAADTIVADGDELLGKPMDEDDARRMLVQLRGRIHQVYTGIALMDTCTGKSFNDVCRTDVLMRQYHDTEVEDYILTLDPMDKAGAYAIQHAGFHPVEGLTGCFASVMGLPLCHLMVGLRHLGFLPPDDLPERCQKALGYPCPVFTDILGAS